MVVDMERTNAEFKTEAPQTVETEKDLGGNAENKRPYGKFNDANSLLKAYESLEKEFTRRSQKLKALEGELFSRSKLDKTIENVGENSNKKGGNFGQEPFFIAKNDELAMKTNSQTLSDEENVNAFEEKQDFFENNPAEKDGKSHGKDFYGEVLKEYLKNVALSRPKAVISGGTILTAPPNKPTTIAEASAIAKNYIKKYEP